MGSLCLAGHSLEEFKCANFQLGGACALMKPHPAMLGVTEWVSFLRSFEMTSPTIFFFFFWRALNMKAYVPVRVQRKVS